MQTHKVVLFLILLVFVSVDIEAQMFSVADRQERITRPTTLIRVGVAVADFTYQGSLAGPEPSLLEVDNTLLALTFETLGLSANAKIGNSITGIDDGSFFDLNLRFTNNINVVRRQKLQAGFPIQLSTGLTTSNNDFNENRFNQSHFSGGAGLFCNINPTRKLQWQNSGLIGYGFSNSNGGFFGGTMNYISAGSRVNLLNFINERTLSIGYDYVLRSYDIDSEIYDYDLSAHQITIGVSF